MDSASPTDSCIAGEQRLATGVTTFFGNTFGKLAEKNAWLSRSEISLPHHREHRQPPHGYGSPS
ncbi:MAG: hypothetical protein ABEJ58_05910 [Halodesulfurarchaeum sp.]